MQRRPARNPMSYDRVAVKNPSDGGFFYWLVRYYAFAACCLLGLLAMATGAVYMHFASSLPRLPTFAEYARGTAATTTVRGWDGTPLAAFAREYREILPFDAFPPRLVQAFLAIEDRRFYEHGGLDLRGIARALSANLRAGKVAQGGSTITQQVAKTFLAEDLRAQRTFLRKIPEAILARRMEARHDKNQILTLYLNQIPLGHLSFGVAAAARRYFDRAVGDLDLGEMATLAGMARAPGIYSPLTNPEATRVRRDQVFDAMIAAGYVDAAEADPWRSKPLVVRQPPDLFRERSPHFAEHVRRDVARRLGDKFLWEGGLDIETTLVPWIDRAAQDNVDFALRKLERRQGFRGPVARLAGTDVEEFRRRAIELYGSDGPIEGQQYLGLVESVAADGGARVRVGVATYLLPAANLLWAFPWSRADSTNGKVLQSAVGVLRKGDVVWVCNAHQSNLRRFSDFAYDEKSEVAWLAPYKDRRPPTGPPTLTLQQTPRVQGAILTYDHDSGYVVAMVGSHDFDRSEFNRAVQACRQPGSTYKPIYYSLALDKGYGYASLLNDIPRAEVDPLTGEVWIPTNLNNTVDYKVTLEYSLTWSKNIPSVQLFKLLGGKEVESWARRLGMTTKITPDQALALGASCTRMDELSRAFSAFARNGAITSPVTLRRVRDRDGRLLEDHTSLADPMGAPDERLDRLVALAGTRPTAVIPPRAAWLTSQLLRRAVTRGHAPALRATGIQVAGKTGTSSATMDVWFVGYTSRWMTTAWLGDDRRERPLGFKDAAFMLAVPMTARYLWEVAAGQPLKEIPWERPAGVDPADTGGTLRTTMEEVKAEQAEQAEQAAQRRAQKAARQPQVTAPARR